MIELGIITEECVLEYFEVESIYRFRLILEPRFQRVLKCLESI